MGIAFYAVVVTIASIIMLRLFARSLPESLGRERTVLLWVVALALFVKLAVLAIRFAIVGHALDDLWSDTYDYDWAGQYIANELRGGNFDFLAIDAVASAEGPYPGFRYVVGIIYALFGPYQWMVSVFLSFISVVLGILVFHMANRIYGHKIARIALVLTLFYPWFFEYTYLLLKDMIVVFLIVGVAWGLTRAREIKFSSLLVPLLFAVVLMSFRAPYALLMGTMAAFYPVFGGFGARGVAGGTKRGGAGNIKPVVIALLAVALFWGIASYLQPHGKAPLELMEGMGPTVTAYHTDVPSFLLGASLSDPVDLLSRIAAHPVAFLRLTLESAFFAFWGVPNLYSRTSFSLYPIAQNLGALFMIFLMPMVLYGIWHSLRHRRAEMYFPLGVLVLIMLTVIFVGGIERWGLPIMPFVLMFGAVGCHYFERIRSIYPIYIMAFAILAAINLSLGIGAPLVVALSLAIGLSVLLLGVLRHRLQLRERLGSPAPKTVRP